ncbi:MAG: hypothetical protein CMO61_11240 [Verrucomicrobiales bacterium]|nr:hypothetical protein [Verrucomicrobiales bacterium]|tara:strand:- start:17797 stop:18009 length:213 start_codon:yes stop_codon:yes gene_type:complete
MTQEEAIQKIEGACKVISLEMMKLTPNARYIREEEIAGDIMKASYQLTIELEVIKKKLIKLKGRDDSSLL